MKNYLFRYFLLIIFLITACEGGTTFTKVINNKSSESITIVIYTRYGSTGEMVINAHEYKTVFTDEQNRSFVGDSFNCTSLIDSVDFNISNGKILIKDIMNSANWIQKSTKGRNSREDCIFEITDNDLQ
jgi:hypothetical protein